MSVEDDFAELYKSLEKFSEECTVVRKQVRNLYRRTRDDTRPVHQAPSLNPAHEQLKLWWDLHGRGRPLTIENFIVRLFKVCHKDVTARTIVLSAPEAALFGWSHEKKITVFELMSLMPKLFA
jgi:hypothetical protein